MVDSWICVVTVFIPDTVAPPITTDEAPLPPGIIEEAGETGDGDVRA
jgi:hypothetical protein